MTTNHFRLLFFSGLGVVLLLAQLSWAQGEARVVVVPATKHVVAPPLGQIVPISPRSAQLSSVADDDDDVLRPRGPRVAGPAQDSVLQASPDATLATSLSTNPGLNVLGLGYGFPGFISNVSTNIPDTNGAAGTTQFVQFVNDSFVVLNKSNGSVAYGPAHGNTLWQALGGACAANTNLDEIAQYDKLANRWVMLMPAFASPGYLCIAVSTTSDATNGAWNLYAFQPPVNNTLCHCRMMTDYPKLAVWPDGYYLSYNQIWMGNYEGTAACVFDRNSMLNGAAATMQCFLNTGTSYGSMLPADLDGTTPPPSGSPEYFLNFDGNDQSLDLWQFHVNWANPSNSTFTGPTNMPVAPFTEACGETVVEFDYSTGDCIPQAGTSNTLDSYGDRIMYRLAYRNYGGYQALVTNHTVTLGTNGSQTGIRWYELQNTGSGFGVYQQGTYAPDSVYRWMGSIAMDKAGDIALGYSVSSSSMGPSIRYTGRVPTDPLGELEGEFDVLSAAGITPASRTNNFRWADYSSIAVDPTDDCTFWYTTEYMPMNGGNWSTRIASFSFPSCVGSFTLTTNEVGQGTVTSADGAIDCTNGSGNCSAAYANGSSVSLTATPATGYAFSGWSGACTGSNPCNLTMTSNLTATATFTATVLNYTLTVNETGQGTVTSADGLINCTNGSGTCSAAYANGSSVTLNAAAGTGQTFTGWSGACSGRSSCNLTMTGNRTATATFVTTPTWALVHKASKAGAITSLTIPATGSGHLIAVALMFNGATSVSSVSDNAGNTYVSAGVRAVSGPASVEIWYAQNSIAGATVITPNFVNAPTSVEITEWEVSGVLALPPDGTNTATGTMTLNNTPGPPVTTTMAGDLVISVMLALDTNLTAISSGNEFTNDFTTYGNGWAHITSNASSAGTHQASWYTASPTGLYCASTVAFAP